MEEDTISDLPDRVLGHILSFLTLKEAARTSILSKRWRRMNICSMLPGLNFNWFDMMWTPNSNVRRKNRRLVDAMDKILLERSHESSLSIEKFFLELPRQSGIGLKRQSLELKLERWMKCVAKPGLTEISVLISPTYDDDYWNFPLETFATSQSLQKMTLEGFQLTSLSYGDSVKFSSLRSLSVCDVVLDDGVMQKLLKGMPLLANLEVDCCVGLKVLQVRQELLKMVEVHANKALKNVVVNAPKLEVLKLSPPKDTFFVETDLPCLRKIKFKESVSSTLNTLVEFRGMKLPIDAWFIEFLPLCPLLEHLSIDSCPTLQNINVSTPLQALKTLRLTNLENMVNVSIIARNLEKFRITAYKNLPVVELDGSDKLEVEIKFHLRGELGDLWCDRLANFLGVFNHSKAVILSFTKVEGFYISKEKRNDLPYVWSSELTCVVEGSCGRMWITCFGYRPKQQISQ